MTKDELYKEFVEVTGIDESFVNSYEKFAKITINSHEIISGVEGLVVNIGPSLSSSLTPLHLTYFHKEESHVDQT